MAQVSKYNKDEVIKKLKSKGLKACYGKTGHLTHIEAKKRINIGLKFWGYIDFLNVPIIRKD